jgi:predicted RND superfamily exporter protein
MKSARHFLLAVLCGLAVIGIFRLRIDVDILNLLPRDNSIAQGLAEYQDKFLQAGEVVVVVQSQRAGEAGLVVDAVSKALRPDGQLIERAFWQPPANESLHDAAQFLAYLWLNANTNDVVQLRDSLRAQNLPTLLADSRQRIATSFSPTDLFLGPRDPLGLATLGQAAGETFDTPEKFFSSEDGKVRLGYIYSAVPLNDYEQCRAWVSKVRSAIKAALAPHQRDGFSTQVLLTGRPVFVDEISSGMRSDMATAVPGTLFLIGVLFYLLHREWISLGLLLTTLFGVMIWTALAGSAVLGQLNVISVGFASILLGLAEDFGIVLHQELKSHPGADAATVRKLGGPGIFWSAITTASAFALLNLSSLPGLKHLGTLVALGIVIGAWAMSFVFLPLLIRFRRVRPDAFPKVATQRRNREGFFPVVVTILALGFSIMAIVQKPPRLDASPDVLRPRKSEASAALNVVQENIGVSGDPFWLLFHGKSEGTVRSDLQQMQRHLDERSESLGIESFTLPLAVWPDPVNQLANAPLLREIAREQERIFPAVLTNGFTTEALDLSRTVFAEWQKFSTARVNWPEGRVADWVIPKFVSRNGTNLVALGLVTPGTNFVAAHVVPDELRHSVLLSGWSLLGKSVLDQVKREVPVIFTLVALTVIIALWLTFRKISSVLLSLAVLCFSGMALVALMSALGWRWNLINLVALPLLLAMGVDYSIHMQTALARFEGDSRSAFATVGRALLLAGSTTIIGFAFLGMSSNLGMASLGRVCALGLVILLLTSVFLLPAWVRLVNRTASK